MSASLSWPHVRWLDPDTVIVIDGIHATRDQLAAEELVQASAMTAGRVREFTAGRSVARHALAALQQPAVAIPVGPGGEPHWPRGVSGSLCHTATHAAALVTRRGRHASVGVDLDDRRLIGDAAAADLMTSEEIAAVIAQGWANERPVAQNIVFLAKEALFKCQYPVTARRDLDFDEVCLSAADVRGTLSARCVHDDPELGSLLANVRLYHDEIQGLRICWALLRAITVSPDV